MGVMETKENPGKEDFQLSLRYYIPIALILTTHCSNIRTKVLKRNHS